MKKYIIIFTLGLFSCSKSGVENLKSYIEYGTESKNYLRWTKDQQITWDIFKGSPSGQGVFSFYIGLYYFFDKKDDFKFNATIYIDKEKSWVKEKNDWGDYKEFYDRLPKLLKLKFDYYEYVMRLLRKDLIENNTQLNDYQKENIPGEYYQRAESEWQKIEEELNYDLSDEKLSNLKNDIDVKLKELESFDTRVNSQILNSD